MGGEKGKRQVQMQMLPLFEDYRTIDMSLLFANKRRQRLIPFVLDALNDWAAREKLPPFSVTSIPELHGALKQYATKANRSISNFVEVRLAEYINKIAKEQMPKVN